MSKKNINNSGVIIDEDKKIRTLDDIDQDAAAAFVTDTTQAEESTSRAGGREVVIAVGDVTSKPRTTNAVPKVVPTRRRRKSNPRRSPLA
uniref:Uncharacterized protein n=1 Tax=Chenopodium quinoa TaxID=63459 RepID=A0A803LH19_CHEQI